MDSAGIDAGRIARLLDATGAHLEAAGATVRIVVVGGAALALRGQVPRTTQDVDVIALAIGPRHDLVAPVLPKPLLDAISRTARDFNMPDDWLNAVVGAQFAHGLPDGFRTEIEWRRYRGLHVGLAGRAALIALKLFAAVDSGADSVHFQDLRALAPKRGEIERANAWVLAQDRGTEWPRLVSEIVANVLRGDGPSAKKQDLRSPRVLEPVASTDG